MEEKKIHVLYYTIGRNIQGLNQAMQQLKRLYGDRIIALPKDLTNLDFNAISIQDLLNIRTSINLLISERLAAENQNLNRPPDMRAGAVIAPMSTAAVQRPPISSQGNMKPGGGYQPQSGPQRPPAPPTSGSNAVKLPPARGFIQGINVPLTNQNEGN